jgi:arylsulfatase A-like enzyme
MLIYMKQLPNILYIFCDELRADALNCYNPNYGLKTPNIDYIAANGVQYNSCYCNSPVCVPSRTSIMTGMYPKDLGVYHNEAVLPVFKMQREYETIPSVLRKAGYKTTNFGKVHLPYGMAPFDYSDETGSEMHIGLDPHMDCINKISPRGDFKSNIGSTYPIQKEYYPERITKNAIAYMRKQDGPYFMRISYLQPHTPIIVPKPFDTLYDKIPFDTCINISEGLSKFEKRFAEIIELSTLTPNEIKKMKVYYYGLVAWIDSQVGQILNYLKASGDLANTIIIFGADHGAQRGENGALAKQTFQYVSHRVPLLIYYPPKISKGRKVDEICENLDLGPTLFHLLDIESPSQFIGRDLFEKMDDHEVYSEIGFGEKTSYAFPLKLFGKYCGEAGWPRRACVRTKRYRLDMNVRINGRSVVGSDDEDLFFVDREACHAENQNMAHILEYREIVHDLREKLCIHMMDSKESSRGMGDDLYAYIQQKKVSQKQERS